MSVGGFDADRLEIARARRGLTGQALADAAGLSVATVSRIVNGAAPDNTTVDALVRVLGFPRSFFFDESIETIDTSAVAFRSLSTLKAAERDASIAAARLGLLVSNWIEQRFKLPRPDLPDLVAQDPEQAAFALRQHWKLGEAPIKRPIKLLESRGVRVFSLAENTRNVDAFSFWRSELPFVFVNTMKTAERSAFDCAHELAHLLLHRGRSVNKSKEAEREADRFASALLMPERGFVASLPRRMTIDHVLQGKRRWHVSAMAFVHRTHALGRLTDWQRRSFYIELGRRGYRTAEPEGLSRESSTAFSKIFQMLWKDGDSKNHVARDIGIPLDELESLVFGLVEERRPRPQSGVGPKPATLRRVR